MTNIFFVFNILLLFTRRKAREISQQNMRSSEIIGHIEIGIVKQLMYIGISFHISLHFSLIL